MIYKDYSLLECQPDERKCKDCTDEECIYFWQKENYLLKQENELLKSRLETLANIDKYDSRYNDLLAEIDAGETLIEKYKQVLKEIKEIVSEPCIDGENCITCNSNCTNKDILNKIKSTEDCIKEEWRRI